MTAQKAIYQFSGFQLDPGEKQLRRLDGEVLPLPPKAFDILVLLVENRGRLLDGWRRFHRGPDDCHRRPGVRADSRHQPLVWTASGNRTIRPS